MGGVSTHIDPMQWFFLLFPLLELWTLIELGSAYGALAAIGWVVLTIFLGISLIRRQGLSMIRQLQADAQGGWITPRLLGDDLAVVTSGLLLIVPGLITDIAAVLVLIGPLRRRLLGVAPLAYRQSPDVTMTREYRAEDGSVYTETRSFSSEEGGSAHITVEGDFKRVDD